MNRLATISLACAIGLGGCATQDGPLVTGDNPVSGDLIPGMADPVADPSKSSSHIYYSNSDAFDVALNASMKDEHPVITVDMSCADLNVAGLEKTNMLLPSNQRLDRWLTRVKSTGGTNRLCPVDPGGRGIMSIVSLVWKVAKPLIDNYLTYKPASNYNTRIFHSEDREQSIERVEFVRAGDKRGEVDCP